MLYHINMISRFIEFRGPKSWKFVDPDTGHEYSEPDKKSLIERVKAYRSQNELPDITAIDLVIENYLCKLPENKGNCSKVKLQRGWYQTLKGGISLLTNLFYGDKNMVDSTTAEARAMQCLKCPLNAFPDKKKFHAWSDSVAEAMTGGRRVTVHDQLGNCLGCSCTLKGKVWYKGPISLTAEESAKMSEATNGNCWQLKPHI